MLRLSTGNRIAGGALVLALGIGAAPATGFAQEATAVLKRTAAALGADGTQTLRYTMAGTGYTFGQPYIPGTAWPKIDIQEMTRLVNYDTAAMREEIAFSRGEPRGGGGYPLSGQVRNTGFIAGGTAWNQTAGGPSAGARFVNERVLQLWTSPQGIVKAAQRNNASLSWTTKDGKNIALVSFTDPGRFKAVAHVNEDYLVEKIEAVFPTPVMGDTKVVTTFSNYRDSGGVKFPAKIRQSMGGHPIYDLDVKGVERNVAADIVAPEAVRIPVERVASEKVTDGVWFLAGGSHNSVVIEMKDHLILVESPLGDERAFAVIEAARKLVPGKPLRYLINSHDHFDHSGGVRTAAAEGLTIVANAKAQAFYAKTFATQNTIQPDRLAKSGKKPKFRTWTDKLDLSDASRKVEVHRIVGNVHSEIFAMVYLPQQKILIEADAFTPGAPNAPAPTTANPMHVNLVENIQRLKLDVAQILPLHGRVAPVAELYTAAKMTPAR